MALRADNAYLNARVSVLAAHLLKPADIEHLGNLHLDDLIARFGLAALADEGLPPGTRLRAVEAALLQTLLSELTRLVRPMYGEARDLVIHWARKFELFNLKALIRGKLNDLPEAEIQASLHDLPPFLTLPHQTLLRTESVLELLRQLEEGPYRAIASQARQVFEERHESFALDAAIDQRYYAGLAKRVRQLAGDDRQETLKVIGLHLDRINLMWMLRYRFGYQLSPSETYFQLVPSPLQLNRERLLHLVNLGSQDQLLADLPEPLHPLLEDAPDTMEVERRVHALMSQRLRASLAHSTSPVARALAYLILRELDLKRVFSAVQARLLTLDGGLLRLALGLAGTGTQDLGH